MAVTAIGLQVQEANRVVAFVTLETCCLMIAGFTHRDHIIVTVATVAKYFFMIDKRNELETKGGMAGLAQVCCRHVVTRLGSI